MSVGLADDVHFDGAGLGDFLLGKGDRQDAIFEGGSDFFCVNRVRDGKVAGEGAVAAFEAVVAGLVLFVFELAFAFEGKDTVFEVDGDVFEFDFGQVGFDDELIFGFEDIDRGRPGTAGGFLNEVIQGVFEEAEGSRAKAGLNLVISIVDDLLWNVLTFTA